MKFNLKSVALLATYVLCNAKKAFAEDPFFGEATRPELFELTDFAVPSLNIKLNDADYENLFLTIQCDKDTSPLFMRRNMACYTASWVNLNDALERSIRKNYIDSSKITNSTELTLIDNVTNKKTHNITIDEFENLVVNYSKFSLEEIFTYPYGLSNVPANEFKTNDATLVFELEGEEPETFENVKFSIGGRSTKAYSKLGYNINLKKGLLHGSKQLRLRAETVDPTFLRDKISYDVYSLLDLPTLSANYCRLYINDTFMGFYLLRDAYKSRWIEQNYGEKNTKHLYSCDGKYGKDPFFNCVNDDTEETDADFINFQKKLNTTTTREELEEFFDVDTYIRWQVSRYLFGAWDHRTSTHNNAVYMYHAKDKDLWIPLLYDFDMNFGHRKTVNTTLTFDEEVVDKRVPFYDILNIHESNPEVIKLMDEMMRKAFNPILLLPRIDQLKTFIDPYVLEDRTPDATGRFPGRFDKTSNYTEDNFSYEDFLLNSAFTGIDVEQLNDKGKITSFYSILGIKQWVIERFNFICNYYNIDCSYADEFLKSPYASDYKIDKVTRASQEFGCEGTSYSCCIFKETQIMTTDSTGDWGIEGNRWCLMKKEEKDTCWSVEKGYPCCKNKDTPVANVDYKNREWGIENGDWCGITDLQRCPTKGDYKCCKGCSVVYEDDYKWGVEEGEWCYIGYSCDKKK